MGLVPKTEPGPPGFDFGVCSPRVFGKLLNIPPYFLLVGHTFLAPLLRPVQLRCRVTHCRLFVGHDHRTVHVEFVVEKLPLCPWLFLRELRVSSISIIPRMPHTSI